MCATARLWVGRPRSALLRMPPNINRATGIQAEMKMKTGALVPDTMMVRLIINELNTRGWLVPDTVRPYHVNFAAPDAEIPLDSVDDVFIPSPFNTSKFSYSDSPSASFILDGFPRTACQAKRIDDIIPVNLVVNLKTPVEVILDRICNRWVHEPSGRVYNTTFNPPKVPGQDDVTGEQLTRRADDSPEVWLARLKKFEETSAPLLEHYDKKGVLWEVEGNSSDEISPQLFKEFEKRFGA